MGIASVKKSISKLPKAIEFVNGNRNATKQFLEETRYLNLKNYLPLE